MKRIYTIISLFFIASTSFAQNYNLNPGNVVNENIETNTYYVSSIYMEHNNVLTDSIELQWELFDIVANGDWDYSYCDYTNCYTGNITSGTMVKYGNNQSGFLKVNLYAPSIGSGHFKFKVFETGDEANADTLTFNFNVTLSLNDIQLGTKVELYPNPIENNTIKLSNVLEGTEVVIMNSLGQIVNEIKASGDVAVEIANLRKGVYFVRMQRNGAVYATRKAIVR